VGMNAHITKPINVNDMFATITDWIKPVKSLGKEHYLTQVTTENTDKVDIPDFITINKSAGLSVTNGNEALYVKLLGRFITGQQDFEERFNTSFTKEDKEESIRFAHTLKGSAGNIGAKTLHEYAGQLEHACDHDDNEGLIKQLLDKVTDELNIVLKELKGFVVKNQRMNDTVESSNDFVFTKENKSQLLELLALVEDFETEALDVAHLIIEQLKGSKQEVIFQRIYQQIEGYEFSDAEVALTAFINNLEE